MSTPALYAVPPLIPPNTNAQSGYVDLLEVGNLIVENMTTEGVVTAAQLSAVGKPTALVPLFSTITAVGSPANISTGAVANPATITASGSTGYPATIQATGLGAVVSGTTVTDGAGFSSTGGAVTALSVTSPAFAYTTKSTYNQATSVTTDVPITTSAGQVVTFGTFTTASAGSSSFNLTGSVILATSQVYLQLVTYGGVPFTNGVPVLTVNVTGAGTAVVTVSNYGSNALAGNVVFNYSIV